MPVVGDLRDPIGAIDRIVGGMPCLDQQRAHRPKVALAGSADEHHSIPSLALTRSLTACGLALPPRRLHHLADEPARQRRLGSRLLDLVGIGGNYIVHRLLDRAGICHLLHAAAFDQRLGVSAFVPDDLEQVFGDLAGNRAFLDEVDNPAQLIGRNRRLFNGFARPCSKRREDR